MDKKRIVFVTVGTTSFDSLVRAVDTREVKEELLKKGYTHLLIQMGRGSYIPEKVYSVLHWGRIMLQCVEVVGLGWRNDAGSASQARGFWILQTKVKYRSDVADIGQFAGFLRLFYPLILVLSLLYCSNVQSSGEDESLVVDYFTFSSSIADNLRSASLVISHAGSGSIFETLRLGKPLVVVVNEDLMDNHQSELAEELAERKHLFCARPQTLYQIIASMSLESLVPYPAGDATPVAKLINRYLGFPDD